MIDEQRLTASLGSVDGWTRRRADPDRRRPARRGDPRRPARRPGAHPRPAALPRPRDARRLGGDRRDRVRRHRAGPDPGDDRPRPDPLRGRPDRGLVGDPPRARHGGLAGDDRHGRDRRPRRPRRALDLRHQRARRDARRRRDRRHRLGGDLRRAAPLDPGEAPGALARGRVGDERPGRPAARDRLHRMDPGPRLRARRHGRPARPQTGDRDRGRRRDGQALGRRARPRAAADRRHLPGGDDRDRRPRLRAGRGRARLRPARRLPDRAGARLGPDPGPAHDRRLPRGGRLGRPDRPLHPARPARLPEHARRRRAREPGALGGADPPRPPAGRPRWRRSSRRSTCASGRCSAGPGCAARRRSGSPPSRSSPGSAPARSCSRSSSSSSSPRPSSRAPASSRWRNAWA